MKRFTTILSAGLLFGLLVSCDGGSGPGNIGEADGGLASCVDGLDNDNDGFIDCDDPDCDTAPACGPSAEDCDNSTDDDGDGLADCDDSDCASFPLCIAGVEDCDNGIDDDGDTVTDCADVDSCPETNPNCDGGPSENCNTAEDDDGDGEANCDDDDCNDFPACEPVPDEICDNGIDDDFDNGIDCADTDCAGQPACPTILENCCNGIDDDGNTLTDFQEAGSVCDPTNTDTALPSGGDTFPDICDNCPAKKNATQQDNDQDGVGNSCDNCSGDYNPDQIDDDGDGFGAACDCDDTNPDLNPDTVWYQDTDGDGYGDDATATPGCVSPGADYVLVGGDCDDTNADANPGATEVCDGVDNDCDGQVDEDGVPVTWYLDNDGDNYGQDGTTLTQCAQPAGYAVNGGDCNDADAAINPGADEICDGVDNNCDGNIDEPGAVDGTAYYVDADGDGFGSTFVNTFCSDPGGPTAPNDDDCNDADANINPNTVWYVDADGDGYGDPNTTTTSCTQPVGYVADNTDCNDNNAAIHPGVAETCNDGLDANCDGNTSEGCAGGTETGNTKCQNGVDDDADGFVDGNDYDCNGAKCGGGNVKWQDCGSGMAPLQCLAPNAC